MSKPLKIYSYSKCGTCRKAILWLKSRYIEYNLIDIIETPPTKSEIEKAIKYMGDRKYILNTSGKSYRSIGANAIKLLSDAEVIQLLLADSKLIKRPFVVIKDEIYLTGFKQGKWEETILS